ncbi:MAG: fasciclin domain-containing protein [Actinobacteria bacterium]|nr:fasciclin domain-containing protein [Actinomycetota bacterium]
MALFALPSFGAEEEGNAVLGIESITKKIDISDFKFDSDLSDYDIFKNLLLDVLASKPKSAAWALADGNVALTAFIPTDRAFRKLVKSLTGKYLAKEVNIYNTLLSLGTTKLEQVLLYHVVIGAPLASGEVLTKNGEFLTTAQGATIRVALVDTVLRIRDKDTKRENPEVILTRVDQNLGNRQMFHPINGVLLPAM